MQVDTESGEHAKNDCNEENKEHGQTIHFVDPHDFPDRQKWTITLLMSLLTLTVTLCSSIFSATIGVTTKEFETSETVMILGVSLFVLGFALGPLLWAPLSEYYGRRPPLFIGFAVFCIFQVGVALSKSLAGILICRFLASAFGAAPIVLANAALADIWNPAQRGVASALYSTAVYAGPALGPIFGAVITESHLGWRWTAWVVLIVGGVFGVTAFILVPEIYLPVLRQMAEKKAGLPVESSHSAKDFVQKYLFRPVSMMFHELMLNVMTVYISVVYATMYLTFYAFPFAFSTERGWNAVIGTLPFLSMLVGILSGCLFVAIYSIKYYAPRLRARGGKVVAEDRLPPVMLGGILLPIGLFWFAWTSSSHISWVPQVISAYFIGAGIMLVFSNGIVYLVDVYVQSAASAIAANTSIRSAAAAGLPLAGPRMYSALGTAWATSVLGFICVALIPAPFIFYKYGERLRRRSKFAPYKA